MANISKVVLPSTDEYDIKDTVARNGLNGKQDTLVSGTNIKTINNTSLLGSGNINISGGGSDVFVAEANVTTYNELVAAIQANKIIYVKYNNSLLLVYDISILNDYIRIYAISAAEVAWHVSSSDDSWTLTRARDMVNVQSDWNQTNSDYDDYIKNKPTIPTVDQTYSAVSANAQSGVAVASAIADSDNIFVVEKDVTTYNELVTAVEAGKYLCFYEFVSREYTLLWIDYIEDSAEGIYLSYYTREGRRGYFVSTSDVWSTDFEYRYLRSDQPLIAPSLTGQIPSSVTAVTQSSGDNSTKIATTAYVDGAVAALPEPMIFKGSLGTGGTITTLPAASSSNEGFVYKVITAGTYASQAADIGDTFISDGSNWVLIPSGDEPSGTVTSIATGNGLSGGPITSSGTISLDTAYGDTVNPYGNKTANYVLAAPNGSNGTPSFRALVADDIPIANWAKANTKPTYTASEVGASSATNWLNGSQVGSARTSGSIEEDSGYIIGSYAVSEGYGTKAEGTASHAEGYFTEANGYASHSEGENSIANGDYSHVEGYETVAEDYSHAEGSNTNAIGDFSHAEGRDTLAKGDRAHTEGYGTIASGNNSHAQGAYNIEDPTAYIKTEDTSVDSSKTYYTLSNGKFSKVSSPTTSGLPSYCEYTPDNAEQAFIIGNGTADSNRSNAFVINKDGTISTAGVKTYNYNQFTYKDGFTPYGTGNVDEPKAVKFGRVVTLFGAFKKTAAQSSAGDISIGWVPSGCEPFATVRAVCQGSGQNRFDLEIDTSGLMKIRRYGTTSVTVLGANAWLNLHCTYISAT